MKKIRAVHSRIEVGGYGESVYTVSDKCVISGGFTTAAADNFQERIITTDHNDTIQIVFVYKHSWVYRNHHSYSIQKSTSCDSHNWVLSVVAYMQYKKRKLICLTCVAMNYQASSSKYSSYTSSYSYVHGCMLISTKSIFKTEYSKIKTGVPIFTTSTSYEIYGQTQWMMQDMYFLLLSKLNLCICTAAMCCVYFLFMTKLHHSTGVHRR